MTVRMFAAALVLLSLPACAAMKGAEQPVTLRLSPPRPAAAAPLAPGAYAIAPVQARGIAGALRYAYVDAAAPSEIRQAKTLFWEEPPTRVLERALEDGLRARFAIVTGPMLAAPPGARRLIVELDRFEETGAGADARATVAFDATVTGTPLLTGHYCASAPIAAAAGTARARAFEAAIAASVDGLARDLARGALARQGC